jgi:hypothetical protein
VDLVHRGAFQWAGLEVAGVVDQGVDAAELPGGEVGEREAGLWIKIF